MAPTLTEEDEVKIRCALARASQPKDEERVSFLPQDAGAFPVLHQFAGFATIFRFSAFISLSSSGVI